jgi:predicted HD phosphohydrolase
VCDPVRLHVDAKRYLCAIDRDYLRQLSPASARSLHLQGGPFEEDELFAFEREPYHREAVQLRRWDDRAKIPRLEVPALAHYASRIAAAVQMSSGI